MITLEQLVPDDVDQAAALTNKILPVPDNMHLKCWQLFDGNPALSETLPLGYVVKDDGRIVDSCFHLFQDFVVDGVRVKAMTTTTMASEPKDGIHENGGRASR